MFVLTNQINRSWIWSFLEVGFVVSFLFKEGMRRDALHQAFLSFVGLRHMFRQSQLQILCSQTDYVICEYGSTGY